MRQGTKRVKWAEPKSRAARSRPAEMMTVAAAALFCLVANSVQTTHRRVTALTVIVAFIPARGLARRVDPG